MKKSEKMDERDFVNIVGDCVDGDFWICGVQEAGDSLESPR